MIGRAAYTEKINRFLGKELIVVLTGQRRVGKSFLLRLLREEKESEADSNVIYIDKERREFDCIRTYSDLNAYIEGQFRKGKRNYILIDEVQEIEGFEHALRSWRTEPDVDVVVTGSNARMLNNELTTLIGGRYHKIHVKPLSYTEFLFFHDLPDGDSALMRYINSGGMPGLTRFGLDGDEVCDYLADILDTVVLKDIIMRNAIRNVSFFNNLLRFVADTTGKLVSANSISRYMKSQSVNVTPAAVLNYIDFMTQAFVVNKVCRYDIHGKRLFENNDKIYFEDHGLRNVVAGGSREGDIEKVVENIVYNHLCRLGYDVYVGQLQSAEIDFVCMRGGAVKAYVQVAYIVADETTRHREFGNLKAIHDNYAKYVVSLTPMVSRSDYQGIVHLHLREFLKTQEL